MAIEKSSLVSSVTPVKLWFGLITSAAAWASLGCLDILITWQACNDSAPFGAAASRPSITALYIVIAASLFLLATAAGVVSYKNWRSLSEEQHLLHADATDRSEFMALLGVIVSLTLGMGIFWLSLPPFMIALCARAR